MANDRRSTWVTRALVGHGDQRALAVRHEPYGHAGGAAIVADQRRAVLAVSPLIALVCAVPMTQHQLVGRGLAGADRAGPFRGEEKQVVRRNQPVGVPQGTEVDAVDFLSRRRVDDGEAVPGLGVRCRVAHDRVAPVLRDRDLAGRSESLPSAGGAASSYSRMVPARGEDPLARPDFSTTRGTEMTMTRTAPWIAAALWTLASTASPAAAKVVPAAAAVAPLPVGGLSVGQRHDAAVPVLRGGPSEGRGSEAAAHPLPPRRGGGGDRQPGAATSSEGATIWVERDHLAKNPTYVSPPGTPGADWGRDRSTRDTLGLLKQFVAKHPDVDPDRLYIVGFSAGGTGAWTCCSATPGSSRRRCRSAGTRTPSSPTRRPSRPSATRRCCRSTPGTTRWRRSEARRTRSRP